MRRLVSLPMALYFRTMVLFIGAALLAAASFAVSLHANLGADRFEGAIRVVGPQASGGTAAAGEAPPPLSAECARGYAFRSGIQRAALGSFCADLGGSSSPLSCAAVCSVGAPALETALRNGLDPGDEEAVCRGLGGPCPASDSGADADGGPGGESGPLGCCSLELDAAAAAANARDVPRMQIWASPIFLAVFLAWSLLIRWSQVETAERQNAAVITAADFSVLVRGLPSGRGSDAVTSQELYKFFSHYGQVALALPVTRMGELLDLVRRQAEGRRLLRDVEAHVGQVGVGGDRLGG